MLTGGNMMKVEFNPHFCRVGNGKGWRQAHSAYLVKDGGVLLRSLVEIVG